jgi:serine/threonine protein phosphatase PrpC
MRIEIAGCTNLGRVRERNEDAIASDENQGIVVLADGMGGYQAGEVASTLAVDFIVEMLTHPLSAWFHSTKNQAGDNNFQKMTLQLKQVIQKTNRKLYKIATEKKQFQGMGTTVVAAIFFERWVAIAHVGDSRMYRLRDESWCQLTKDHTVVQELIEAKLLPPQQARHDSRRHLITRALGVGKEVAIDLQEQEVFTQDIYLLCSDGLYDMLEDHEIKSVLSNTSLSLQQAAHLLIDMANEKGGEDNISLLIVRPLFSQPGWLERLFF